MKPSYLEKNDIIYLIAPSFGCTTFPYEGRLKRAIKNFEKLGYKIHIGENVYKCDGICASSSSYNRAKEFMDAYESDAKIIMSVGGGETMVEILEHIDFEKIKSLPPKYFVGFSDNTNLTYTLTTICDIETIYGNNAPNFYSRPFKYDTLQTYKMLIGEKEFEGFKSFELKGFDTEFPKYNLNKRKIITAINYNKPFEGILLGGCLDCLVGLCGTKFDNTKNYINKHKDEGIIFYMEACDLNSIGIRRALFQLKMAGWFDNVKGFLIGRTRLYKDKSFEVTPVESYIDLLKEYNVPLLINIDLGHLSPSMPMKNGAYAKVLFENNNIKMTYKE